MNWLLDILGLQRKEEWVEIGEEPLTIMDMDGNPTTLQMIPEGNFGELVLVENVDPYKTANKDYWISVMKDHSLPHHSPTFFMFTQTEIDRAQARATKNWNEEVETYGRQNGFGYLFDPDDFPFDDTRHEEDEIE